MFIKIFIIMRGIFLKQIHNKIDIMYKYNKESDIP